MREASSGQRTLLPQPPLEFGISVALLDAPTHTARRAGETRGCARAAAGDVSHGAPYGYFANGHDLNGNASSTRSMTRAAVTVGCVY